MDFHQVKATSINFLKKAELSFLAKWFFKLYLRSRIHSQNIWFFNKCLHHKVTPKYMKLKTDNYSHAAKEAQEIG